MFFILKSTFEQHLALSQANKIINNYSNKLNIFEKCYKMCAYIYIYINFLLLYVSQTKVKKKYINRHKNKIYIHLDMLNLVIL